MPEMPRGDAADGSEHVAGDNRREPAQDHSLTQRTVEEGQGGSGAHEGNSGSDHQPYLLASQEGELSDKQRQYFEDHGISGSSVIRVPIDVVAEPETAADDTVSSSRWERIKGALSPRDRLREAETDIENSYHEALNSARKWVDEAREEVKGALIDVAFLEQTARGLRVDARQAFEAARAGIGDDTNKRETARLRDSTEYSLQEARTKALGILNYLREGNTERSEVIKESLEGSRPRGSARKELAELKDERATLDEWSKELTRQIDEAN